MTNEIAMAPKRRELLARLAVGVSGGLLLALAALFLASATNVRSAQTGASPAKAIFFAVWSASIVVSLLARRSRRCLALLLAAAGAMFALAALVPLRALAAQSTASRAFVEVTAGLAALAVALGGCGAYLLVKPRADSQ